MPLQTLHTPSRNKAFDYKYADGEEIIAYPSGDDGHAQEKDAIVITRFEQQLVKDGIRGEVPSRLARHATNHRREALGPL